MASTLSCRRLRHGVSIRPWKFHQQKKLARKLAFLTVIFYPFLYFLFGCYVLWQLPEARMLCSGSEAILPFGKHMLTNVFQHDPWLYPWQILRGSCWVLLAWPVMRMSKGRWWETGFTVDLLFAMLMNAQHLIPNPYMGTAVQWRHFMEIVSTPKINSAQRALISQPFTLFANHQVFPQAASVIPFS